MLNIELYAETESIKLEPHLTDVEKKLGVMSTNLNYQHCCYHPVYATK